MTTLNTVTFLLSNTWRARFPEMFGEEIQMFAVKVVNKNTKLLKVKTIKTRLNVFGREKIVINADVCVFFLTVTK